MTCCVSSIFRPALFAGKSAIVTGGGTGIGKAITQELLYLGCRVMIASRNKDRLSSAYEEMKSNIEPDSAAQLEMVECNIRKDEQVENLIKQTLHKFGQVDYLVNNAGGQFPSAAENITTKGFSAVVDTNLIGTFICCREVYNQWMVDHGGVIVNIIADMWKGFPNMSHTGAARSGVDNLTKSLSLEWAPAGIRVNAVAPGAVETPSAAQHYSKYSISKYGNPDFFKNVTRATPFHRPGNPQEISAAVLFLLSPAAAFISGETMRVDGAHSLYGPSGMFEVPDHDKQPAYTWEEDAKVVEKQNKKSKL